jgi:nitrite reductase/ring-hydroxylating ferredoxin subunit
LTPSSLPTKPDQVQFLDTQLPAFVNTATNPTGAVAVLQHGAKTYCFSSSCPRCKIPLNKALIAETPETGVVMCCDFCSAKFSLKSGEFLVGNAEVEAAFPKKGLLSGITSVTSKLFEAQGSGPLPLYKLSQVGGKLVIALDWKGYYHYFKYVWFATMQ